MTRLSKSRLLCLLMHSAIHQTLNMCQVLPCDRLDEGFRAAITKPHRVLQTTAMYCLTAPERCWQGWLLLRHERACLPCVSQLLELGRLMWVFFDLQKYYLRVYLYPLSILYCLHISFSVKTLVTAELRFTFTAPFELYCLCKNPAEGPQVTMLPLRFSTL